MRLIWTTDPHLNHVTDDDRDRWIRSVGQMQGDGMIVTGDISEGPDVIEQLKWIGDATGMPIHFVLGNHDFYRGSIASVRQQIIYESRDHASLHYLTDSAATPLVEGVYLIGEDGWGDATEGDYERSSIQLNDFVLIRDFHNATAARRKEQLNEIGAESATRLEQQLQRLPADARHLLVATHVPPFCEACWYEGHTTDANWAPFFVCGQVGRVLRDFAERRNEVQVTVLCGHTHHHGIAGIRDNLRVYTGAADYGSPAVEAVIECDLQGVQVVSARQ